MDHSDSERAYQKSSSYVPPIFIEGDWDVHSLGNKHIISDVHIPREPACSRSASHKEARDEKGDGEGGQLHHGQWEIGRSMKSVERETTLGE